jgi:hypothetical protein
VGGRGSVLQPGKHWVEQGYCSTEWLADILEK